jgi:hypothetical protein
MEMNYACVVGEPRGVALAQRDDPGTPTRFQRFLFGLFKITVWKRIGWEMVLK